MIYRQKNEKKMDTEYIDKCQYKIQELEEIPVWYTGISPRPFQALLLSTVKYMFCCDI
jgi:hypothetical protein